MSWLMRLTNNSLATMIAWVSTCLLAGGVSTLFSESTRTAWMIWGSFGLAAALGLDVVARVRERMRIEQLSHVATHRFARDMHYANEENEAYAAIREATAQMLGHTAMKADRASSGPTRDRHPCDLHVELLLDRGRNSAAGGHRIAARVARITNLSEMGFELTITEPLSRQRMKMMIVAPNGRRLSMLGEVLWCATQPDGSFIAGGRFLDVVPLEAADTQRMARAVSAPLDDRD
jgi:hypothetical protein